MEGPRKGPAIKPVFGPLEAAIVIAAAAFIAAVVTFLVGLGWVAALIVVAGVLLEIVALLADGRAPRR